MALPKWTSPSQVPNAYPEKPIMQPTFSTLKVEDVAAYIKSTSYPENVKQATLALKALESGWGGTIFNNNVGGVQTDGNRWNKEFDNIIIGTVLKKDWTGYLRRFAVFADWRHCIDFKLKVVFLRGLYIGGTPKNYYKKTINTVQDFAQAYQNEWVQGDSKYIATSAQIRDTSSVYRRAVNFLNIAPTLPKTGDVKKKD